MPDPPVSYGRVGEPDSPAQLPIGDPMTEPVHQSVRDYIAAKKRGDTATTSRIIAEATARFNTRTTDGTEYAELLNATMTTPLGTPNA